MAPDPRVYGVDHFTTTTHSCVPDELKPENVKLPAGFTVCIIGASQGIGEYIAYAYAKAGATNILISSRTLTDLEAVAGRITQSHLSVRVEVAVCDIASAESVEALSDIVRTKFGRLDVVVPNAAYAPPLTLRMDEGDPKLVQRAFDVNALGTYYAAHYFVPLLLASGTGVKGFLAVGSIAGCIRRGIIANTGYTISKMVQTRIIEYLGEQYGEQGLLAVSIHPGAVHTAMAAGNTPEQFLPYLVDKVDLCGAVCVWLSMRTKELHWLTGRLVSSNWDMDELLAKRDEIVEKDLLKFALLTA
jgi:NAD(P)-dependent dehydrogenase (short-subunit alcohol dehydrogenase family)